MKHSFILIAFELSVLPFQNTSAQISYDHLPSISIGVGYVGELLTHPGLVVYSEVAINKGRNQLLGRLNYMHYRHRAHTRSHLLLPELTVRRHTRGSSFWEAAIGLGALAQWADAPVREYDQGEFGERRSGWLYAAPSMGIRYGRPIILNNGQTLTPNIGGRFFYQYPFNDFFLLRTAVDLSVSYQIK